MLRSILTTCFVLATIYTATPLTAGVDSVKSGPGYVNQVWYKPGMLNTESPQASWHLGFQSGVSATIIINDALTATVEGEAKAFKMYLVPNSTPATYDALDTAGMSTWTRLYNKPATWTGALNSVADASNIFDYGWGKYNIQSHMLNGARVFVFVMPDGSTWKLFIQAWSGFSYTFKYARIDGSDARTGNVNMNGIVDKTFMYWSFVGHTNIDREPPSDAWDLTFLKYTDLVQAGPGAPVPYPVTGFLARPGIKLAKVTGANPAALQPPPIEQFDTTANLIGWDWKTFDQGTGKYTITDSTAYFILRRDGSMWKMVMTGFTGSSTGTAYFNAEIVLTSVADADAPNSNVLGVHPNIVGSGDALHAVFEVSAAVHSVRLVDVAGRTVLNIAANLDAGMHAIPVSASGLATGHYRIVVQTATHTFGSALIIR